MGACKFFDKVNNDSVARAYLKMHWPMFTTGDYNLNIFGIRANESVSNAFNDCIGVLYKENNQWKCQKYEATTDPGLISRTNPVDSRGCAILQDGYHRSVFRMGYHQGKYPALVQVKPLPLWRDNNRDNKLDHTGPTYNEIVGINIHHASNTGKSKQVDNWSAGCQVIADIKDWNNFWNLIATSSKRFGHVFSYALFTETDFFRS